MTLYFSQILISLSDMLQLEFATNIDKVIWTETSRARIAWRHSQSKTPADRWTINLWIEKHDISTRFKDISCSQWRYLMPGRSSIGGIGSRNGSKWNVSIATGDHLRFHKEDDGLKYHKKQRCGESLSPIIPSKTEYCALEAETIFQEEYFRH